MGLQTYFVLNRLLRVTWDPFRKGSTSLHISYYNMCIETRYNTKQNVKIIKTRELAVCLEIKLDVCSCSRWKVESGVCGIFDSTVEIRKLYWIIECTCTVYVTKYDIVEMFVFYHQARFKPRFSSVLQAWKYAIT
jgi:hypothetical protein